MMFLSLDGFTAAPLISKSLVSLLPKKMGMIWFKIFHQILIHLMISLSIVGFIAASASPLSILLVLYLPKYSTSAIYQTLPLCSKRFHFFSNQIKINGFKTPGSIFIWFLSENKRTQKARKEKGTSLASLPSQTTHPRTLSIYWTYQCFCTIKKQVALTGNKN